MPHCNILQVKKGFTSFLLIWRSAIIYILIKLYQNPKYSLYYWRSSIVISIYKCSYLDIATYDRARLYLCVKHCVILCGNFETCISILRETMSKLCDLMSYFRDMYIDVARNFVKIVWSYVIILRRVHVEIVRNYVKIVWSYFVIARHACWNYDILYFAIWHILLSVHNGLHIHISLPRTSSIFIFITIMKLYEDVFILFSFLFLPVFLHKFVVLTKNTILSLKKNLLISIRGH